MSSSLHPGDELAGPYALSSEPCSRTVAENRDDGLGLLRADALQ